MHWTELLELRKRSNYRPSVHPLREYGDNDPADPFNNWEPEE